MSIKLFQRISWHLRQGVGRLGAIGVMGLGVLALCPVAYLSAIQPKEQQLAALQPIAVANKKPIATARPEDAVAHLKDQLASFYTFFPEHTDMIGQVENLFATAKKYHLTLENGSYELIRGDTHQLARCEVQLPIRGSYVQTRRFLAELLLDMPNVALSSITVQREKIGASVVDAQIKLTSITVNPVRLTDNSRRMLLGVTLCATLVVSVSGLA